MNLSHLKRNDEDDFVSYQAVMGPSSLVPGGDQITVSHFKTNDKLFIVCRYDDKLLIVLLNLRVFLSLSNLETITQPSSHKI